MDRYGKRLLAVAGLLGAFALSAVWIAGAMDPVQTEQQTQSETDGSADGTAAAWRQILQEATGDGETAQAETADPMGEAVPVFAEEGIVDAPERVSHVSENVFYYVSICTTPGAQVTLCDTGGRKLQQAVADTRGYVSFQPVAPGQYRVLQDGHGGRFRLLDNASVEALDGTLWSDGELLHVLETVPVRLRVECSVPKTLAGRVVTVTLRGEDGSVRDRSFVAGTSEAYAVEFSDLSPGQYELWKDETLLRTLTVTEDAEQTVELD